MIIHFFVKKKKGGIKIIEENINYWKNVSIWPKDKIKIVTKD